MKTRRAFDAAEDQRRVSDLPMFAPDYSCHAGQEIIVEFVPAAKARRVLNAFEERRPTNASLAYVRGKLVELYESRVRAFPKTPDMHMVTADDADRILKAWPDFPSGGSQNWRGSLFRGRGWERIPGDVPSLRPSHNGTPLARWRPRL